MKLKRTLATLLAAILLLAMAAPAMADDILVEVEGGVEEVVDLGELDLSQLDGDQGGISEDQGAGAEVALDEQPESTEETEPAEQAEEVASPEATQAEGVDLSQAEGQDEPQAEEETVETPEMTGDNRAQALQDAIQNATGPIELNLGTAFNADDLTDKKKYLLIPEDKDIILDLAGHNINASESNWLPAIVVAGKLTLKNTASTGGKITHPNEEHNQSGVNVESTGTLILEDGVRISGNTIGVKVVSGTFIMNGGEITDNNNNTASPAGGGVFVGKDTSADQAGAFTMNGGKITDNQAGMGGGVYVENGSAFTMNGGVIGGDKDGEENTATSGGGVAVLDSAFTMNGGEILRNIANGNGGGVSVVSGSEAASITLKGGAIAGNSADRGGGVYVDGSKATFEMSGGEISANNADRGGGVYAYAMPTFTMTGGIIGNNTATRGGGVYCVHPIQTLMTVTLGGGEIRDNRADLGGGGVCFNAGGSTDAYAKLLLTGAAISNNQAVTGGGVSGNTVGITLNGSKITGNTAVQGGGINLNGAPFAMASGEIIDNTATGNPDKEVVGMGGGVYVQGTETPFAIRGGRIAGNTAGNRGLGGGVFADGPAFELSGGEISDNQAQTGGGVLIKNNCALLMTGGEIIANQASGKGGGLYIFDESSRFSVSGEPSILDNTGEAGNDDVYLEAGRKINVTGALSGAWMGVRQAAEDLGKDFTAGYAQYNGSRLPSNYFICNDSAYGAIMNKDNTEVILAKHVVFEVEDYIGVYDGKPHGGAVKLIDPADAKIKYCINANDGVWTETKPEFTDVGEHLIIVGVTAAGYATSVDVIRIDITQADPALKVDVKDVIYGEKPAPSVTGYNGDGKVAFLYAPATAANAMGNAETAWSETAPTAVGDYLVKATVTEGRNYKAGESKPVQFRIHHAKVTVKAQDASKVEGEADPEFKYTAEGLVGSDTITGALARETGETAGTYKITLGTLSAGDNYRIDFTGATFTITGKDAPKPEPTDKPEPQPTDKPEPEDKEIAPVVATVTACGKDALKIAWTRVSQADGYDVYLSKCGEPLKQLGSTDKRFVKVSGLKKQTLYRVVVKAWTKEDGDKTYIATSPTAYAYTSDGNKKTTNPKCVTVKARKVSLKVGKKTTIKASVKGVKSGKKVLDKGGKIRYVSSDPSIAKVNSKGRITAVSKGTCVIYVLASNGVYKTVTVKVK